MTGVCNPPEDSDGDDMAEDPHHAEVDVGMDYTVTEVSVTVLRRKQIEQYEPFEASETITAEVMPRADIEEVTEELHDTAKEHVQRDIVKRVEEKQMKNELEG